MPEGFNRDIDRIQTSIDSAKGEIERLNAELNSRSESKPDQEKAPSVEALMETAAVLAGKRLGKLNTG